ncbi:hypothetical protein [Anaerostipes sp.]|uniref:hypothetical protein n=1 Tax=Anaerostipes sp. TaxID=1872530 RepID=UPI0025B99817|nr:hypothetical protein [Anaerostipes sp.]MBS7007304.1 hypothetical protein [Anaerostipes sp.]
MRYYKVDFGITDPTNLTLPSLFNSQGTDYDDFPSVMQHSVPIYRGTDVTRGKEFVTAPDERDTEPTPVNIGKFTMGGAYFTSCFVLLTYNSENDLYIQHFQNGAEHLIEKSKTEEEDELYLCRQEDYVVMVTKQFNDSYRGIVEDLIYMYGKNHVCLIDGFENFYIAGDLSIQFCAS